ncbi:MAG: hypothetical protein WDM76_03485 [Limisphaerales bacterium]
MRLARLINRQPKRNNSAASGRNWLTPCNSQRRASRIASSTGVGSFSQQGHPARTHWKQDFLIIAPLRGRERGAI